MAAEPQHPKPMSAFDAFEFMRAFKSTPWAPSLTAQVACLSLVQATLVPLYTNHGTAPDGQPLNEGEFVVGLRLPTTRPRIQLLRFLCSFLATEGLGFKHLSTQRVAGVLTCTFKVPDGN